MRAHLLFRSARARKTFTYTLHTQYIALLACATFYSITRILIALIPRPLPYILQYPYHAASVGALTNCRCFVGQSHTGNDDMGRPVPELQGAQRGVAARAGAFLSARRRPVGAERQQTERRKFGRKALKYSYI